MADMEPPTSLRSVPPEGAVSALGRPGAADLDDLKAQAKKLNAKATQAKMDLHDLSEELPTNWEQILDVAQRAHEAHAALMSVRQQLAAATPS
jgi:hypothetical protein